MNNTEKIEIVKEFYGKTLTNAKDLKTSACSVALPARLKKIMAKMPKEVISKFYGCGNPIPNAIKDLHVLDLGSGSGRDCYIAAALVGEKGSVTGIDMTDEQLAIARKYVGEYTKTLGYKKPNMKFIKGYIESFLDVGVKKESKDMVVSNCVVNLSPDKDAVLSSVYQALREGGEFHFSDLYCDRRLTEETRKYKILYGEGLSGALYINDFIRLCHKVGFKDPRVLSRREIKICNKEVKDIIGEARFYSITYRLFKLKDLETLCEDYGQYALYKGTMEGSKHSYVLDDHHKLITNKPFLVCGNTASMLSSTWLKEHFTVHGDKSVHYGLFNCSNITSSKKDTQKSGCC